ncbi:MAG TPA: double zinc ribbon domain-containing protein [Patescibacteria group bacterium]|nr:double zinc ribbon domain-containing protein [Patescibacteria group bacterium]
MSLFSEFALDLLYPPTCLGCERDGAWLCRTCLESLPIFRHAFCPKCGSSLRETHPCENRFPFASVIHAGPYADPRWRLLITSFKYKSAICLQQVFRLILVRFRDEFLGAWPWAGYERMSIVPIPPDPVRARIRNLDHAAILADAVHELLVPWGVIEHCLERNGASLSNALLERNELRSVNVAGAFRPRGPIQDPVLLIDDVFTSGATTLEAARALFLAGAPAVHVFTFATGR